MFWQKKPGTDSFWFTGANLDDFKNQKYMSSAKLHIGVYEMVAVIWLLKTAWRDLQRVRLLLWCDNAGVIFNLAKGKSPCKLCAALVRIYWDIIDEHKLHVRLQYVNTKRNLADLPSRMDNKAVQKLLQRADIRAAPFVGACEHPVKIFSLLRQQLKKGINLSFLKVFLINS